MTNTLSKEASQKIKELGISLETEMIWVGGKNKTTERNFNLHTKNLFHKHPANYKIIPAPNFQELLLTLKEIGKKLGWGEVSDIAHSMAYSKGVKFPNTRWEMEVHHLTDIFLEKGMSGVSKEIINLIK